MRIRISRCMPRITITSHQAHDLGCALVNGRLERGYVTSCTNSLWTIKYVARFPTSRGSREHVLGEETVDLRTLNALVEIRWSMISPAIRRQDHTLSLTDQTCRTHGCGWWISWLMRFPSQICFRPDLLFLFLYVTGHASRPIASPAPSEV